MSTNRQLHYLEAMGITPWVRRDLPLEAESIQESPVAGPPGLNPPQGKKAGQGRSQGTTQGTIQGTAQGTIHGTGAAMPAPMPASVLPAEAGEQVAKPIVEPGAHGNSGLSDQPSQSAAASNSIAIRAASGASDEQWKSLRSMVAHCSLCELHRERTQTVFGVGNQRAAVMVIGEAPGFHEDKQGEPFVGRAGALLNRMLQAIGLDREAVYIANVLKCRPPNNRDPRAEESESCNRYLEQQIEFVDPQVILAVGRISAQHLLDSDAPIGRLRGQVHQYPGRDLPLVVTYHPAYLLRSPEQKGKSMEDLLLLKNQLALRTSSG